MIAFLRGTLQSREITGGQVDRIIIDVSGVGFELAVSHRTALSIGELEQTVTVHTALSIRETEWVMFGFSSRQERDMFNLLQSVSGVGPKLALAIVGTLGTTQTAQAVISDDQKLLSQAPGVGAKVAQRIILELKSKIEDWQDTRGMVNAAPSAPTAHREEARAILEGLGYTATEINIAFQAAQDDSSSNDVELLVRHSLKVLGAAGR